MWLIKNRFYLQFTYFNMLCHLSIFVIPTDCVKKTILILRCPDTSYKLCKAPQLLAAF